MEKIRNGFYFMFEIGWFVDLLIPTIVRAKDGDIYLVGSKPCEAKNLKPCCIPLGGAAEVKKLSPDDAAVKAFKTIDSLVPVNDLDNLADELKKSLENREIHDKYLNTKARMQREATTERIINDYQVLSGSE
jgi:hypothetical protein